MRRLPVRRSRLPRQRGTLAAPTLAAGCVQRTFTNASAASSPRLDPPPLTASSGAAFTAPSVALGNSVSLTAASASSSCSATNKLTATTATASVALPHSLEAALFGLTDRRTSVLTYPDPHTRVARDMPLLPAPAARTLFLDSGWLDELVALGEMPTGPSDAATTTTNITKDWKSSSSLLGTTFADVLGRGKVMRYLLYEFLRRPELWWDSVRELLELATQGSVEATDHLLPHVSADDAMRVGGGAALHGAGMDVVLYGAGLRAELMALLLDDAKAQDEGTSQGESHTTRRFDGPAGLWRAYLVARRQDAGGGVPSPQRPPFSFGETRPSVQPADLAVRAYAGSVELEAAAVTALTAKRVMGGHSARLATLWDSLSEQRQNELLFGFAATVGSAPSKVGDGIFVVDDATDVDFSDVEAPPPAVPATVRTPESGGQTDEFARARVYRLDDFYLGLVEPLTPNQRVILEELRKESSCGSSGNDDGYTDPAISFFHALSSGTQATSVPDMDASVDDDGGIGSSAGTNAAHAPVRRYRRTPSRAPTHQWLPGGNFRHYATGLVEDAQLFPLWVAFQAEPAAELLDAVQAVRGAWPVCTRETVRRELATQAALLLLFFSRDEVRAVTPPADTYARLWALHAELTAVVLCGRSGGAMADISASLPAFDRLPLEVQASYTCFGAAHLPVSRSVGAVALRGRAALPITAEPPVPCANPLALYVAYAQAVGRHTPHLPPLAVAVDDASTKARESAEMWTLQEVFASLLAPAALAIEYPFPRTPQERAEAEGFGERLTSDERPLSETGYQEEAAVDVEEEGKAMEMHDNEVLEAHVEDVVSVPAVADEEDNSFSTEVRVESFIKTKLDVEGSGHDSVTHTPSLPLPPLPARRPADADEGSDVSAAALSPHDLARLCAVVEAEVRVQLNELVNSITTAAVTAVLAARGNEAKATAPRKLALATPRKASTPSPAGKRGRGRPRKHTGAVPAAKAPPRATMCVSADDVKAIMHAVAESSMPSSLPRYRGRVKKATPGDTARTTAGGSTGKRRGRPPKAAKAAAAA